MIEINNSPRALSILRSAIKFEISNRQSIRCGDKLYNTLSNMSQKNRKIIIDSIFDTSDNEEIPILIVGGCDDDSRLNNHVDFSNLVSLFTILKLKNIKRILNIQNIFSEDWLDLIINPLLDDNKMLEVLIIKTPELELPFDQLMEIIDDDKSDVEPITPPSDEIYLSGTFAYNDVSSAGGIVECVNTLKLLKNGEKQNVQFTYRFKDDVNFAAIDPLTGELVFDESQLSTDRNVVVVVECVYDGKTYSKEANAKQNAYQPNLIEFIGNFSYSIEAPAAGGGISPINSLRLVDNNTAQNVVITYSSSEQYASVDEYGAVVFSASQVEAKRQAIITATCVYKGQAYTRTAVARQAEYVPDVIVLDGIFQYQNAPFTGGSVVPTNTLRLLKNGVPQPVQFTFSSNQTYAVVNQNGAVTFEASGENERRSAIITASCVYNGKIYTKTANIEQNTYAEGRSFNKSFNKSFGL